MQTFALKNILQALELTEQRFCRLAIVTVGSELMHDLPLQIETAGAGHLQVKQKQIGEFLLEEKDGGLAVVSFVHLIAGLSQQMCKRLALDDRIVGQQDPRFRSLGRRRRIVFHESRLCAVEQEVNKGEKW